jgi:hypothetical protein
MYYKYYYSFIYNWSKFKKVNLSKNENDFYFGTEEYIRRRRLPHNISFTFFLLMRHKKYC